MTKGYPSTITSVYPSDIVDPPIGARYERGNYCVVTLDAPGAFGVQSVIIRNGQIGTIPEEFRKVGQRGFIHFSKFGNSAFYTWSNA